MNVIFENQIHEDGTWSLYIDSSINSTWDRMNSQSGECAESIRAFQVSNGRLVQKFIKN